MARNNTKLPRLIVQGIISVMLVGGGIAILCLGLNMPDPNPAIIAIGSSMISGPMGYWVR